MKSCHCYTTTLCGRWSCHCYTTTLCGRWSCHCYTTTLCGRWSCHCYTTTLCGRWSCHCYTTTLCGRWSCHCYTTTLCGRWSCHCYTTTLCGRWSCHCYTTTPTSLFVVRVRNTSSAIWVVAGFGPSLSLAASPNLFCRHCYNSLCHKADYFHSLSPTFLVPTAFGTLWVSILYSVVVLG